MSLHRCDLAYPHQLPVIQADIIHGTHSHDRMDAIEASMMEAFHGSQQSQKDTQLHDKWC
jgi:hypothetical protein